MVNSISSQLQVNTKSYVLNSDNQAMIAKLMTSFKGFHNKRILSDTNVVKQEKAVH